MIIFEITGTEDDSEYRRLEHYNAARQLDFLESMVPAALHFDRKLLSQAIIKALNFHAIACLHVNAGEYRPCPVTVGSYNPPEHYRVEALMDDFVNTTNMIWKETDLFFLSAYVLWRLNYIHPFINGNGRTARACCYFVLCVKAGGLLPGRRILPKLLQDNRDRYINALQQADTIIGERHFPVTVAELVPLTELIRELLDVQLSTASR